MGKPLLTPDDLTKGGFDTVIVASPDLNGRFFGRRCTTDAFLRALDSGVDICTCVLAWDVGQDVEGVEVDWAGFQTGWHDFQLVVDLDTLRPAAWLEGTAICLTDAVEVGSGAAVAVSPRNILKRQAEALEADGLTPIVSTELEFYLYRGAPDENRLDGFRALVPTTLTRSDYQMQKANAFEGFFRNVRNKLAASGIEIDDSQAEWGLGQWEIGTRHGPPLEVADNHAIFKMAVHDMAAAAGLTASFMARPHADQVGSSCHVHTSMKAADGTPVFYDADAEHSMSDIMRRALAGAIRRTSELMLWYGPTVNSYKRLNQPDFAGGGLYWGFDNRTTSYRVLGHTPESIRFESRLPGADVNPYHLLAAFLASVRDGITDGPPLGEPVKGNAYDLEITGIPEHLGQAAEWFRASDFARTAFGDAVVDHHATMAQAEWKNFRLAVTDWELERYLDRI